LELSQILASVAAVVPVVVLLDERAIEPAEPPVLAVTHTVPENYLLLSLVLQRAVEKSQLTLVVFHMAAGNSQLLAVLHMAIENFPVPAVLLQDIWPWAAVLLAAVVHERRSVQVLAHDQNHCLSDLLANPKDWNDHTMNECPNCLENPKYFFLLYLLCRSPFGKSLFELSDRAMLH